MAGLLRGPNEEVRTRGGGGKFQYRRLAEHLDELWVQGEWPPGAGPIIVTDVSDVELQGTLPELQHVTTVEERKRLRACEYHLSKMLAGAIPVAGALLADPSSEDWYTFPLVRVVERALLDGRVKDMSPGDVAGTDASAEAFREIALPLMRVPGVQTEPTHWPFVPQQRKLAVSVAGLHTVA